ncbi:MAG: hypothetical protein M1281_10180 [Chloroflexi bacterium]|nr:hypothetical protein [Chloroflexota bacterium]
MPDPHFNSLVGFNRQVVRFQEEAFTLAYDLLGNEAAAVDIVQGAFSIVYCHAWDGRCSIRLKVLRQLVRDCTRCQGVPVTGEAHPLTNLPVSERLPLLLVDRLGLTYPEAAWVLHCSMKKVSGNLAQARRKVAEFGRVRRAGSPIDNANSDR